MDRSPIEQPTRQRVVFTIARRQVWRHFQKVRFWSVGVWWMFGLLGGGWGAMIGDLMAGVTGVSGGR